MDEASKATLKDRLQDIREASRLAYEANQLAARRTERANTLADPLRRDLDSESNRIEKFSESHKRKYKPESGACTTTQLSRQILAGVRLCQYQSEGVSQMMMPSSQKSSWA